MKISTLIYYVDHGSLALPCFAREYVWKPSQVISLFNSLYCGYPAGSLILWDPVSSTIPRQSDPDKHAQSTKLIIDGQQRIAAIYGVVRGRSPSFLDATRCQPCQIRFHIESGAFQSYEPEMKNDPRWINPADLFSNTQTILGELLDNLFQTSTGSMRIGEYAQRLNKLAGIMDRDLCVEYLPTDVSLEDAAKIFRLANCGSPVE